MKKIISENGGAWLRLAFAITALALASHMAKPKAQTGATLLASLPKPGVQEW